ncbi:MAG: YicC/YloC family endoribonuclease, partial [Pseudomonadota bacterium]
MSIKSMTGFASREGSFDTEDVNYRWTWDIRSVNGKSLDMRLRVPPFLSELDQTTRKVLIKKLGRGNVQAHLSLDQNRRDGELTVNNEMLNDVLALSRQLSADHGLPPVTVDTLLAMKGVVEVGRADIAEEDKAALHAHLLNDFSAALDDLIKARLGEGTALIGVLDDILSEIGRLTAAAKGAPERAADAILAKLNRHVSDLVGSDHGLSEERLYQEALIMAAKADIQEELDRLFV